MAAKNEEETKIKEEETKIKEEETKIKEEEDNKEPLIEEKQEPEETEEERKEKIKTRGKQTGSITDLERPWGITTLGDNIISVESEKHCITICNKDGTKIKTIGEEGGKMGQFMEPTGVATTTDGHILVTDRLRVQKFDEEGKCVASASSRKLNFHTMLGITVDKSNGRIYIADGEKHCIIVASPSLAPLTTFGSKGSEDGEFNKPRGVAVDSSGRVFVADLNNDRVCVFSSEGKYLSSIGKPGTKGELDRPSAVAIDNRDFLYVTEMVNGRVFVYDKEGEFVHSFGRCGSKEGEYSAPQDVTVDKSGNVIISDTYNNRVCIV